MSYSTTSPVSFSLPAGQVFAVRTKLNAGGIARAYGATSSKEYSIGQASAKTYGPYTEDKTVIIAAISGSIDYDFGASVNLPGYSYSNSISEHTGAAISPYLAVEYVNSAAAAIPGLPYQGDGVFVKDENGATWPWNGASYGKPLTVSGGAADAGAALAISRVAKNRQKVVGGMNDGQNSHLSASTDFSCTSRLLYTTKDALGSVQVQYDAGPSASSVTGGELQQLNGTIYQAALEYPLGSTPVTFSCRGLSTFVVQPDTSGVLTDILGCQIPAGAQFAIRTFARVPTPPTSLAAAPVAGGGLTAQQWYYAITTVDNGIESGPSAEFSATTATTNLAIMLSWTPPAFGDTINVYRSSGAGGTKQRIGFANAKASGFVDWGFVAANTASTPPAVPRIRGLSRPLLAGESTNRQLYGGTGANLVASAGALGGQVGFGPAGPGPNAVIGGGALAPTFGGEGDSIQYGTSIQNNNGVSPGVISPYQSNWFAAACIARGLNYYQHSVGGSQNNWFLDGSKVVRARLAKNQFCDYLVSNLGSNDIAAGRTWQQVAADIMVRAKLAALQGSQYIPTTQLPRSTSTDNWITTANQTPIASNPARVNLNNWMRNGFQVDGSGSPVLSGGAAFPYLSKYLELADLLEVNSVNALTRDGGYCRAPVAARYPGLALSGAQTTTALAFSGTPFTAATSNDRGISVHAVKITSGTRSGDVAIVSYATYNTTSAATLYADGDTSATGIAVKGLGGAPSAADTVDIYETYFVDGVHATLLSHQLMSSALQTFQSSVGG